MSSKIPRGLQPHPEMKKTANKLESKDTAAVSNANAIPKTDGILKPQKDNVPRKNFTTKVHKGVSTRYGQQAELRDQNQLLMAANEELQKNLTETQQKVSELEVQFSDLEKENADVERRLKDCHVLLVAKKIDPVLGERIGEAALQNEDQRREAVSVSTDLLNELRAFGDIASVQLAQLEAIQTTMKDLTETRDHLTQERENFSLEVAEMEKALEEAEALLLE
ncbi:small kinetochore-associated protein [Centroberyx affinis]|uniref:small kinetochore-associated protein n=1 Tax=Centroberyx affinis TaxID=166261 RepID=UPI003A5BE521